MSGPDNPPRTPVSPAPIAVGRSGSARNDGSLAPFEQPIHRRPRRIHSDRPDDIPAEDPADSEPVVDTMNDDGEIVDSAQPQDEDGVTDDMSTMAISPTHLKPGDLERL